MTTTGIPASHDSAISRRLITLAPSVTALTAWISINPYFVWGTSRPLFLASVATAGLALMLFVYGARPRSWELASVLTLTAFVAYITLLPRVDGGHTKWIFVLPTLWILALMHPYQRLHCLRIFSAIFAVTLVPGVIVSLLAIAGVPLTFERFDPANPQMDALGMLHLPGVLFFEANSVVLPWGGVLFRLCGMYDEPGTVGTMSALLLAAYAYRLNDWRLIILYVAGVLSFSLAFLCLTLVGLILTSIHRRSASLVAIPVVLALALVTGYWNVSAPAGRTSSIAIKSPSVTGIDEGKRIVAGGYGGTQLRPLQLLDNRSNTQMAALVDRYASSELRGLLFGLGSDASVVYGGLSQTWKRLLTDSGVVGFGLFCIGLGLLMWAGWRNAQYSWPAALLLLLFSMSLYQRPVVWMPYSLLILFCSPQMLPKTTSDKAA